MTPRPSKVILICMDNEQEATGSKDIIDYVEYYENLLNQAWDEWEAAQPEWDK